MNPEHLKEAEDYPGLGPHYFAARETAKNVMEKFDLEFPERFEPMAKKFADELYHRALDYFRDYLLSDTEHNVQDVIWRQIDDSVEALMSGERWAIERYCLTDRYDGEKIREAVAKHIPNELRDKRIDDLEKEVADLKKQLEWARR